MRSMRTAVLAGVLVVLGSMPAAAQGAPVQDQSMETFSGLAYVLGTQGTATESLAQTFTAGLSGPLVKVELHLSKLNVIDNPPPEAPLTVEIRTVSAGDPTTTVLATATIPWSAIPIPQEPAWVPAEFAVPTTVVAGTRYAIVAYTDSGYAWSAANETSDHYTAGSRRVNFSTPPSTTWTLGCGGGCTPDLAFRTFVEISGSPPVAVADAYNVLGGGTLTVPAPGILANDTDPDSDPLTAVLDSTTTRGSLTLNANGSFTYTPGEDTVGTDSFTYHANDGTDDSNTVTVTITVRAGCDGRPATQVGTAGNDTLGGSGGNDVIVGLGGNDTIEPGSGTDIVCGGSGRDSVRAGSGNDTVFGGSGDDLLDGGSGNDRLFGEAGIDRLFGGGDNDALDGGADSPDRCDGEGGSDTATASCEVTADL
jgi:VCBS repeat-containing protein